MAKRGRKKQSKKQDKFNLDIAVVGTIIASILLAVLIYTNSGFLGERLSPILGGIMGFIKYIIPIGVFAIGINLACNKSKDYLFTKLIQYCVFLVCVAVILSVFQISSEHIDITKEVNSIANEAYDLGQRNIGGGVIGTILALPLVNLVGTIGTAIIAIGVAIIMLVFIFAIKPSKIISDTVDNIVERREERKEEKRRRIEEEEKEERKANGRLYNMQNDNAEEIRPHKETLKERKLREREEKKKALEINEEQLTFNLKGLQETQSNGLYNHAKDEIVPLAMNNNKNQNIAPDVLDGNLFKEKVQEKEIETKQELNLEHTMVIEDENYEFPPIELLSKGAANGIRGSKKTLADTATKLQKTLYSFGVSAKVENVSVGPAITRYELKPAEGVRVSKIANLADDIALNLAAESIRIEAPIPGKQAVGIEVPNTENEIVHFRDIIDTDSFRNHKSNLAFALGKDVAGEEVITDIAKMPHVLIAGATGSGKSVCINTLISSLIYKSKPSQVKLVMIDPKIVELSVYNGIPHLLIPVVTDPKKAAGALAWAVQEMENRYATFAKKGVRDLKGYNEAIAKADGIGKLPHIVIIIDELADLMMVAAKDVEDSICRLAQKARAAGMHLVIATQRPSVDVITGIIKANIPSRIAFAVSSQIDSRTILDMVGAEKLLGKGDMLFYPAGASKPTRVQGAFVSDGEVEKIVDFLKANGEVKYNEDILESIENSNKSEKELEQEQTEDDDVDPFLLDAIEMAIETGQASTSFIQRRFKVGYARAGRIIDQMEERGIISGYQGSKPREVLMSKERWAELKMATNPVENNNNNEINNSNIENNNQEG